jgi:hypothetical protein
MAVASANVIGIGLPLPWDLPAAVGMSDLGIHYWVVEDAPAQRVSCGAAGLG